MGVEVTVMMLVGGGCDSVVLWKRGMVVVNDGDIGGGKLGSGDRSPSLVHSALAVWLGRRYDLAITP